MCSSRARFWAALLALWLVAACTGEPEPLSQALPTPTPRPTPQATLSDALAGARFAIYLDKELLAIEELAVQDTEAGLVIRSEVTTPYDVQRRSLLLSGAETPLRYELEERVGGARSLWVAERDDGGLTLLADDLNWPLPVVQKDVAPAATTFIEGRPSALPYALLAWQQTAPAETAGQALYLLDLTTPLAVVVPLTVGSGGATTGELIGAEGYHGSAPAALNPEFDFWVRERTRLLLRVRVANYQPGHSASLAWPALAGGHTLTIERVSQLPALSAPDPESQVSGGVRAEQVQFIDALGNERTAWLQLPDGPGPHPAALLVGPEGLRVPWRGGAALVAQGWAALSYAPRGLAGPEVRYARGEYQGWGADAVAAAQALGRRSDISGVVAVGWREGALVVAQALALDEAALAGAVLLDPPVGPIFPAALEWRIEHELAPALAWNPDQVLAYRALTLDRGRDWLFDDADEITSVGRRIDVSYLRTYNDTTLADLLGAAESPVLLLADPSGRWTSPDAATVLAEQLGALGRGQMQAPAVTGALFAPQSEELSDQAATLIVSWLQRLP